MMGTTGLGDGIQRHTPTTFLQLVSDGYTLLPHGSAPATTAVVLELDGIDWSRLPAALIEALSIPGPMLIGFATTELPEPALPLLEQLAFTVAPAGPGATCVAGGESALTALCANITEAPRAATALHGLLRVNAGLAVPDAIVAEAATYSMLLADDEFGRWRESTPCRPLPLVEDPVLLHRQDATLHITLNNPSRRNSFSASMRDALVEAMRLVHLDDTITDVELRGNGPTFCSGGDLDEFGTANSPVEAYLARLSRNPGHLVYAAKDRMHVHLHGAAIGAGIELAAFSGRVTATADCWIQLPELKLGLVPGAGGTVSIPRRIGRWRTAWMVVSGERLDARTALAWGLVDELV